MLPPLSCDPLVLDHAPGDVSDVDSARQTPLHVAYSLQVVTLHMSKGANENATNHQGRTPLHEAVGEWLYAVSLYPEDCVASLVHAGADLNAVDDDGETPLHVASALGNAKGDGELLWHGGDETVCSTIGLTARSVTGSRARLEESVESAADPGPRLQKSVHHVYLSPTNGHVERIA